MTEGEKLLIDDLNEFIRQGANQLDEGQSTGIQPHPLILRTETVLTSKKQGLEFSPQPIAEAGPEQPICPPPEEDVCPDTSLDVTVEISGYTSCGCVDTGINSVIIDMTNANGTWVLPNYDATNWILFAAFTATIHTYPDSFDCTGSVFDSEVDMTVQFQCTGAPLMLVRESFPPFGPPFLFTGGIFEIDNGATIPYTGGDCGDSSTYGSGGEAVVSW